MERFTRNVRWWDWVNGGYVKLTLRPGQTLRHHQSWDTDEGWASESNEWHYCDESGKVFNNNCTDGRDCDGRLTRSCSSFFAVGLERCGNAADEDGIRYPMWERLRASQRDYAAEAMGY